ncbi:MAG: hypothetical protein IT306_09515 [Chloroflexi bacterium]|nr:hypothetical protein [Chloroflexota bacterium]
MPTPLTRLATRLVLLAVLVAIALPLLPGEVGGSAGAAGAALAQPGPDDDDADDDRAAVRSETATPTPTATITPTPTVTPTPTPPPLPSRDWRKVGYASVVDGQLYDPFCRPLRSAGSNVPNLMFREGLRENLEWMRQHQIRWMRVIATGHGQPQRIPEAVPGVVEQRLATLLREVEAFNAAHPPQEAVYVLVSLTDYYEPGVPGDQYGFDHPNWCNARVLNAPWYRRGHLRYSFEQECGGGKLTDAPNYEVHFKPWVERLVAAGARSPALLGWQLGNEMKAKDSKRNKIDEAYEWYVEWTADMTDTIRRIDQNHLIFAGAQYMAELSDWPYRPDFGGGINEDMLEEYRQYWDTMLRGCDRYCWNVWSLTDYDFRHYALDDAMFLRERGVAAVMTEYGFTVGTAEEEQQRFGGDRRRAHREGLARPWQDLRGDWQPRNWGTLEMVEQTGVQGIAPWGSPAPFADAAPWIDLDALRGISLAREGDELWQIWRQIAANLELGATTRGISADCAAYQSD